MVSPVQSSLNHDKGPGFNAVHSSWFGAGAYDAAATHPYIPQTLLPLCSHPDSDMTRLVSHGDTRPLAKRSVPQRRTPEPREGRHTCCALAYLTQARGSNIGICGGRGRRKEQVHSQQGQTQGFTRAANGRGGSGVAKRAPCYAPYVCLLALCIDTLP